MQRIFFLFIFLCSMCYGTAKENFTWGSSGNDQIVVQQIMLYNELREGKGKAIKFVGLVPVLKSQTLKGLFNDKLKGEISKNSGLDLNWHNIPAGSSKWEIPEDISIQSPFNNKIEGQPFEKEDIKNILKYTSEIFGSIEERIIVHLSSSPRMDFIVPISQHKEQIVGYFCQLARDFKNAVAEYDSTQSNEAVIKIIFCFSKIESVGEILEGLKKELEESHESHEIHWEALPEEISDATNFSHLKDQLIS